MSYGVMRQRPVAALRRTVTIDLDGTIARTGERVLELMRQNHQDSNNAFQMYAHAWQNPSLIRPYSYGISAVLDKIAESSKIVLLTGTSGDKTKVCEFFEIHGLRFDELLFLQINNKFDRIISDPQIKIVFDDDPYLAFPVAKTGRKAIMPDGPWNFGINCLDNPQKMIDWSEALSLIET